MVDSELQTQALNAMHCSFAIFKFATEVLGGSVIVNNFELEAGSYTGPASLGDTMTTPSSNSTR